MAEFQKHAAYREGEADGKERGNENGLEKWTGKSIALINYMGPHLWHRIDIVTTIEYRDPRQGGRVVKTEKRAEIKKAYN